MNGVGELKGFRKRDQVLPWLGGGSNKIKERARQMKGGNKHSSSSNPFTSLLERNFLTLRRRLVTRADPSLVICAADMLLSCAARRGVSFCVSRATSRVALRPNKRRSARGSFISLPFCNYENTMLIYLSHLISLY